MGQNKICSIHRDGILRESKVAEEIWQIVEGFEEVPANMLAELKKCGINVTKLLTLWIVTVKKFKRISTQKSILKYMYQGLIYWLNCGQK